MSRGGGDVLTPAQRSFCMSRNRGRDTGPEIHLRRAIWKLGLRYRLRLPVPGRPDLAFPGARLAVFVDGCFWHGCPEHAVRPRNNADFWAKKLARTRERDAEITGRLREQGWTVLRLWEHEIDRSADAAAATVAEAVLAAVGHL
ncbi:MAG TPA: very short patch repair endonuclease [Stellaceae bacterium]|nr:very short patch repair endonuclease [Stellaceae bacterium]